MRDTIWNKKIPTILGLFLLIAGVAVTSYLAKSGAIFQERANPSQNPNDVRITNVSDTSFTVSYTTDDQALGSISYGTDQKMGTTALDDRDQQKGTPTAYNTHFITLKGLQPQTKYYFSIISGELTLLNNGSPFQVTTGAAIGSTPPVQNPMSGKIANSNGSASTDAIVYVTIQGAQTVSTLVGNDGTYIIPLNSIRDVSLSNYFSIASTDIIHMLATNGFSKSNVTLLANQVNPVPLVTLSQDYDFSSSPTSLLTPVSSASANILFPALSASSVTNTSIPKIVTPSKNEEYKDQQPLFQGTAPPGTQVTITVHSQEIKTTVTTNSRGVWTFRPPDKLAPGNHTITITAKDASGALRTITQQFVVFAEGTQVNQTATPSASLTPTKTPTPTSTTTPKLSPTAAVSPTVVPTAGITTPSVTPGLVTAPSPSVTQILTPTITVLPSPTAYLVAQVPSNAPTPLPVLHPGSEVVNLGIIAAIVALIGTGIFFATKSTL